MARIDVEVEVQEAGDPPIEIFKITLSDSQGGNWEETLGSKGEARAFLKGARAFASFIKGIDIKIPIIS